MSPQPGRLQAPADVTGGTEPLRVLLVEDSPDDALLVMRAVDVPGRVVEYVRVETERELRRQLLLGAWDIVISDYVLPGFSGLEAVAAIRESHPDLPIVIVSGTIGEDVAVEAVKAGANDYVMKSNLGRLGFTIERAIRERDARRAQQMERELREHVERRFDGVLDAVPSAVVVVDASGIIVRANAHVERVVGYPPEDLLGTSVDALVPDSVRDEHEARRRSYLVDPVSLSMGHERDVQARRRDGSLVRVEVGLAPVASGDETLVVVLIHDITERLAMEHQLQEALRMESLGRLAGGIAHDFNNLLTVINGYADLVAATLPAGSGLGPHVAEIRGAGARGAELVRRLLAFGRRQSLRPQPVDLAVVMEGLRPLLERLVTEAIELEVAIEPGTRPVLVDHSQFEQAIVNLVANARDAMPGGGSVTIQAGPDPVTEDVVRITVADTGTGIADEIRDHLFTPFFTTKAPGQGTGLGLASVHGFVTQSGGSIEVGSSPSGGALFTIRLPATGDADATIAPEPTAPSTHGRGELILVVEDDPTVRALVATILDRHGYVTHTVERPSLVPAALEGLGQAPAALVTDVVMPGRDGRALARELRRDHPAMGIVLMSGYAPVAGDETAPVPDPLDGLEHAFFVAKPFDAERLVTAVGSALTAMRA